MGSIQIVVLPLLVVAEPVGEDSALTWPEITSANVTALVSSGRFCRPRFRV